MEDLWNICGISFVHPLNVPATSTFHLSTAVFETFVFQSQNLLNSVHNVQKCSLCSKTFTMFENVQKRRNVIKCGLGVTYPLTSLFCERNIVLLHPIYSMEQEWFGKLQHHDEARQGVSRSPWILFTFKIMYHGTTKSNPPNARHGWWNQLL